MEAARSPGFWSSVSRRITGEPESDPAGPSFEEFYRAETPRLVRFLLWQGARLPDAADVAQEAMISAYARWAEIRHPRAWIRRVAAREHIRRQLADREDLVDEFTPLLSPDVNIAEWEQRHDILAALRGLPHRQRQVLAWSLDGFTPEEIAAELGLSPEAVRASLYKGRRALAAEGTS